MTDGDPGESVVAEEPELVGPGSGADRNGERKVARLAAAGIDPRDERGVGHTGWKRPIQSVVTGFTWPLQFAVTGRQPPGWIASR